MTETVDNVSAIFDGHVADEFVAKDVAATMATIAAEPLPNTCPALHLFAGIKNQGTIQDSSEA
jgi:carboxymethylenebutenolidase